MVPTDITIVICSYNRADWLREAIESLDNLQTRNKFSYEVLVVDNASTDHTKDVVMQMAEKLSCPVRYVLESQPGVSFARNRGVEETKSNWIAFFDDDEIAEPDWLLQLFDTASKYQVKCVGGGVQLRLHEGIDRELRHWVRVTLGCTRGMEEQQYDGKRVPTTANMLIHTEVFDKVGLFRTDLVEGGEDTDLFHRMRSEGYEAWFTPRALVHHQIPPFRIKNDYLRSTAMRMGSHIARREFEHKSYLAFLLMVVARLGHTLLVQFPKSLLAKLGGDQEKILERRCYLWMWKGYFESAFQFLIGKNGTANPISFRNERQLTSD